jgi:hypothetical protein
MAEQKARVTAISPQFLGQTKRSPSRATMAFFLSGFPALSAFWFNFLNRYMFTLYMCIMDFPSDETDYAGYVEV